MDAVRDAVVDIQAVRDAKAACEAEILAALNRLERATGLEAHAVRLGGQRTVDGVVQTAEVSIEAVLR